MFGLLKKKKESVKVPVPVPVEEKAPSASVEDTTTANGADEEVKGGSDDGVSLLDTLALLGEYSQSHTKGSENVKSCMIHLTKARRSKAASVVISTAYTTEQLREEFVARAVVTTADHEEKIAPELSSEDATTLEHAEDIEMRDTYTLHLNGVPRDTGKSGTGMEATSNNTSEKGLRQRKGASDTGDKDKEEWTVVTEHVPEKDEFLHNIDPITLFDGMPPQALREAQKKAREALEHYVKAANLAAKILKATAKNEP
jgi:hypothetical protein